MPQVAVDGKGLAGANPVNGSNSLNGANPLTGTSPLSGIVTGEDGKPAAGVVVRAFPEGFSESQPLTNTLPLVGNSGSGLNNSSPYRTIAWSLRAISAIGPGSRNVQALEAKTDANGVFGFSDPPEGKLNLEAVKTDDLNAFKRAVEVKKGQKTDAGTLGLEPVGAIIGRVSAPTDSLIKDFEGTQVFIPGTGYSALADKSGSFSIKNVSVGQFDLVARKGSMARAERLGITIRKQLTTSVDGLELKLTFPKIAKAVPSSAGPLASVCLSGENFGASTGESIEVFLKGQRIENPVRARKK